ncbi:hypothetical protein FRX31_019219 [Thalictrum thalictroides]|uniref:Uncharacterized protein n=1 Tax=Thalictrum thalictroides TaxID=46969 RepID=A0A7J6W4E8_THATH|nr:hypothetical protein FRX31_019219 [Thalictrum thalictroides]
MLQWMGGSRRKVTTSRKSTQKRQKQYFEQKKRKQQETSGFDSNVDGLNICGQYHEKSKSLDILSFHNLATVNQECKSSLTEEEIAETGVSPVKRHFPNCSPTSLITRIIPKYAADHKEAKTNSSAHEVEYVSPKQVISSSPLNIPSSYNDFSNKIGDRIDNKKTEAEQCNFQELSVLDLLGDDGPNENSEGTQIHEAHVAFSVEGLGKMGMGTPVHSPHQPGRILFNGISPRKPAQPYQSSKFADYVNDLEHELDCMIHARKMPPCSDPFDLRTNPRGIKDYSSPSKSKKMTVERCMPLDMDVYQRDTFFSDEDSNYVNIGNERLWKAGPTILDENFLGERTHDAARKNQAYNMDSNHADFWRDEIDNESDFTFEDPFLINKRDVAKALKDINVLDSSASYLKHWASEKDHDFTKFNAKRYPAVNESWDLRPAHLFSFAGEDAKEDVSFEESCSSSAVKGDKGKYCAPNSILEESARKYRSVLCRNNAKTYSRKDLHAEGTVYKDLDKESKEINRLSKKLCNQSTDRHRFRKDFNSWHSWLPEEGFTSTDMDLGPNLFQRTSAESDVTFLESENWSEDVFGVLPSSSLDLNKHSLRKKSKLNGPIKYGPSGSNLLSEKALSPQPFSHVQYCDSPSLFNMGSESRKKDITQASRMQDETPHSYCATGSQGDVECPVLVQTAVDSDDESEIHPSRSGNSPKELEKEPSVGNNDFISENGKDVVAPCSKSNSEGIGADNDTLEHADETSSAKNDVRGELGRYMNDNTYRIDGHMQFPSQICTEEVAEKEDSKSEKINIGSKGHNSKNPSYQVMLESYVLQLLCVQKVLREATEQDSLKKL